jgi:hypothetical protein
VNREVQPVEQTMRTIAVIVLVKFLAAVAIPTFADGSFLGVNDPTAPVQVPAPSHIVETNKDQSNAQGAKATRASFRQLKIRHPWEELALPPTPSEVGHHMQSVIGSGQGKPTKGKKSKKVKVKGPRPVMEVDDDASNDDEVSSKSPSVKVGKEKQKKIGKWYLTTIFRC